jgi:hypothetical protein
VKLPGCESTLATKSARPIDQPLAGGNGPLNLPVAGSIVGSGAPESSATPRPVIEEPVTMPATS